MKCPERQSLLVDYYFKELDIAATKQFQAHLSECSACWQEYLEIKKAIEFADRSAHPELNLPDNLRKNLREKIKAEYGRSFGDLLSIRIPAYAVLAALLVGVVITFMVMQPAGPTDSQPPQEVFEIRQEDRKVISERYDSITNSSDHVF